MTAAPFAVDDDGLKLFVRVTPRANRNAVEGVVETGDGRCVVAIRLAAPPVDGAANRALVQFLAERLGVPVSSIAVVAGGKARLKTVRIAAAGPEVLAALHP